MHFGGLKIRRLLLVIAVVGLLAAAFLAYWPGVHGPFLFDDNVNIVSNSAVQITSLAPQQLLRAVFSSHSGLLYRPLSMLSFALDYYFFGAGSFSFKLTNVLIHLVNALLILWLTWRLLVNCKRCYRFEWSANTLGWASVLIAAAWALHPLNLTAVLYIVQRMTSFAALFTLAGMLAYVYGRERALAGKTGWPLVWLLTPFFGILGVLCKEDAALLPLFLLIIEWLVFGFRSRRGGTAKNVAVFYIVGLVLPGLLGIIYLVDHRFWAGFAGRDFTLGERLLTELRVVLLYVRWTFFPNIRELALYHDDLAVSTSLFHPLSTLWSLLGLAAMLALAIWQRRRRPLLCLGILFFFAGQLMESTVLPLELAFEHRNYLPDYGLILAFFSLLLLPPAETHKLKVRLSLRWTIAVIVLPVLFCVTLLRAYEWSSYLDFGYYEAKHHPRSERALYVLAQAYSNLALAGALKNPDQAIQALSQAAAISTNIMPDVALMLVSAKLKLPVNPAWQRQAENILLAQPVTVQQTTSLSSLVNCLPTDCKALALTADALLHVAFQSAERHGQNPDLWVVYSNYLTFTGHPLNEVMAAMAQAAKIAPGVPQYQINLAKGYIVIGDFPAAEKQIQLLKRMNLFGSLDYDIAQLNQRLAAARAAAERINPPASPFFKGG